MKNRIFALCLVIGIIFFMVGLHGIDNAWNMQYLEANNNIHLTDNSAFGQPMDKASVYNSGLMVTFAGFLISLTSALFLFYTPKHKEYPEEHL